VTTDPGKTVRSPSTPGAYLTPEIPGIGGVIKQRPEDFLVEEMPLYEPSGEGEHLYLFVQKRELSTMEMIRILAGHFGVRERDIGYAGLKDRIAITRQVISVHVPGKRPEDFPMLTHEKIGVLWADLHANKLRRGHLKGNRFSIRMRDVKPTDVLRAKKVLDALERSGVPNRFGPQRFGSLANNHLVGIALLREQWDAAIREMLGPGALKPELHAEARRAYAEGRLEDARAAFPRSARSERAVLSALIEGKPARAASAAMGEKEAEFVLSAFQSAVFNAVLDERLRAGTLDRLLPGDVAARHGSRALFDADDAVLAAEETAERLRTLEISPSGPLWSMGMRRASGETDRRELEALAASGVTLEDLERWHAHSPHLMPGDRRPLRVPLTDPDIEGGVDEFGPFVRCVFDLPRGAFATSVLAEIMKTDAAESAESDAGGPETGEA
jgi:tRNA pseudouridine13 synthase